MVVVLAALRVAVPFEDDARVVILDHRGRERTDGGLIRRLLRLRVEAGDDGGDARLRGDDDAHGRRGGGAHRGRSRRQGARVRERDVFGDRGRRKMQVQRKEARDAGRETSEKEAALGPAENHSMEGSRVAADDGSLFMAGCAAMKTAPSSHVLEHSDFPVPADGEAPAPAPADTLPRRRFLVKMGLTVAGAAVGLMATGCEGDEDQEEATGSIPAGNVSAIKVGSLQVVADKPVAIGRDAGGLYALTTICTHEKCNIAKTGTVDSSGLACSCHGSRFTVTGAVTSGPASSPLKHYKVDLGADGAITINADSVVDANARTTVPG